MLHVNWATDYYKYNDSIADSMIRQRRYVMLYRCSAPFLAWAMYDFLYRPNVESIFYTIGITLRIP